MYVRIRNTEWGKCICFVLLIFHASNWPCRKPGTWLAMEWGNPVKTLFIFSGLISTCLRGIYILVLRSGCSCMWRFVKTYLCRLYCLLELTIFYRWLAPYKMECLVRYNSRLLKITPKILWWNTIISAGNLLQSQHEGLRHTINVEQHLSNG